MPDIDEYYKEISDLWNTHLLTNGGAKHIQLENELKHYLDVSNIKLFANGHMALESALEVFEFPYQGEIITTPFTFASTTNAIIRKNLIPVFCDINDRDYTIDTNLIETLINEKTVGILPVHIYGNMCNVEELERIAKKHGLKLIYDAAHAFGVKYKGVSSGSFGDISMFSFHATKVFNTIEGGGLCFNDNYLAEKINDIKNFGIRDMETVFYAGGNSKMNEFQAAMGLCNLRYVNEEIKKRKKVVEKYKERLLGVKGIVFCEEQKDVEPNYAYMPIVFDNYKFNRDRIYNILAKKGIESRKYFYPLTSDFDFCKQYTTGNLKNASFISRNVLTLPLYGDLDLEEVDIICNIVLGN